jgi:hypothetical protein
VSASLAEPRLSRRQLLLAAATAATGGALVASDRSAAHADGELLAPLAAPATPPYLSRPDLRIPPLRVATPARSVAPGLILVAPYNAPAGSQAGAMIVGNDGNPLWEQPLAGLVTTDFRVQQYRGVPALTWWEGVVRLGHGIGGYVIADTNYAPIARVNAGNGYQGDLHEFLLTDRGTALLTTYAVTRRDLRSVGGSQDGTIQDAIFQEVEVATGDVLLEWHSLDHIPLSESYWPLSLDWDYVHLNSIAVDSDENLLVSSRNTHTVYKIDRRSGEVIWRLGGRSSDFQVAATAGFAWQHDARRQPDGSITMFDNGYKVSRAIVLRVDESNRRVTLSRSYTHPSNLLALSQGNVQVLPNGNIFVGWGAQPYVSEFTPGGELIFDAQLPPNYVSYRSFRMPWVGTGAGAPAVATRRAGSHTDLYISWNGDTRVTHWTALAGTRADNLATIGRVARTGFETGLAIPAAFTRLRLRGTDQYGATVTTTDLLSV